MTYELGGEDGVGGSVNNQINPETLTPASTSTLDHKPDLRMVNSMNSERQK